MSAWSRGKMMEAAAARDSLRGGCGMVMVSGVIDTVELHDARAR